VVVLKDDVIDLETISGNLHQNSASPENWSWKVKIAFIIARKEIM